MITLENKNEIFGKRLKLLRNKKGESQEDVATALGISRARYSHYENNHVEPDIDLIRKLADYHKIDTDYLIGRSDNPNKDIDNEEIERIINDPQTNLMFKDWKNMNEEQRQEALTMIKYILYKDKKGN
ncbi:helix-turn-helix domain-containing protein [Oceanobacillus sp. CF4.6]|uniref:helix-turn-helix domain-containing protein n=1 Tax=Oceanobacillus sp. CF4.6 TaxID=3373080 RepID=UPI003EE66EF1